MSPATDATKTGLAPQSNGGPVIQLRDIGTEAEEDLGDIAELHMELLDYGPMAGLGKRFIREVCYRALMRAGVLQVALYEVDGQSAGFVAYTGDSSDFHRTGLRQHWFTAGTVLFRSLLEQPGRIKRLLRAIRVLLSRRSERPLAPDSHGEVVCIAVRPRYLKPQPGGRGRLRISEELVRYAGVRLRRAGIREMRMLVDADNKAVLLLYHSLGARFEPYVQAGEPMVQVWFDLQATDSAFAEADESMT